MYGSTQISWMPATESTSVVQLVSNVNNEFDLITLIISHIHPSYWIFRHKTSSGFNIDCAEGTLTRYYTSYAKAYLLSSVLIGYGNDGY